MFAVSFKKSISTTFTSHTERPVRFDKSSNNSFFFSGEIFSIFSQLILTTCLSVANRFVSASITKEYDSMH